MSPDGSGDVPRIPVFDVRVDPADIEAVEATLRSGDLLAGERTAEFERRFAELIGAEHVVALSSCTAALHVALLAAGVGPGDEVIVPPITFVATANAVRYVGAKPVFADVVSTGDLGIDIDAVESLIGERTKVVIPVHYAGYPIAIERLAELCERHGVALIEDAAHTPAIRARPDGGMLGTFGIAGCFSFFPNKVLGIGEGGALATDSAELADRIRSLIDQGRTAGAEPALGRYDVTEIGFNYRFDDPRAALLLSRLDGLQANLRRRREIVGRYLELLDGLEGITIPYADFDLDCSSGYLMCVIAEGIEGRRALRTRLADVHGVQTTMFPPLHRFSSYREAYGEISLPVAERATDGMLVLPLFPHLTAAEQERIVEALAESLERSGLGGRR